RYPAAAAVTEQSRSGSQTPFGNRLPETPFRCSVRNRVSADRSQTGVWEPEPFAQRCKDRKPTRQSKTAWLLALLAPHAAFPDPCTKMRGSWHFVSSFAWQLEPELDSVRLPLILRRSSADPFFLAPRVAR